MAIAKRVESTKKKSKHLEHYDTPQKLSVKWQMDVKYVPKICYVGKDGEVFYQYTMIDEATRERFIYAYKEISSYSTVEFVQRAIEYFGYAPDIIQTDNGSEFKVTLRKDCVADASSWRAKHEVRSLCGVALSILKKTERIYPLDALCAKLDIVHKTIRPRTPWHNGKVERSHRSGQERFYNFLKFYSYEDLLKQMREYLRRSNKIPMSVLDRKTPLQKRQELEAAGFC